MNKALFVGLVTAQIIIMFALLALIVKLLGIIRAEGLSVVPPAISAKLKRWLPGGGRKRR